jgi:peptide-methionine (S)-S-oxide reductase
MEEAYFAGGCFWCTEAIFQNLKGVTEVVLGYAGGTSDNPDYEEVSGGQSGHAETIKITFDPNIINYEDLVYVFIKTHDPTTVNQQGSDVGSQYRSVVFYTDEIQKQVAINTILKLQPAYKNNIITEVKELDVFYLAEDYHQNFYNKNPDKTYCKLVIDPKIENLKKEFKDLVK